jgi:two-component system cell cycle sensor histidine kinase/response regulator CckA
MSDRKTILLIDDDPLICEMTRDVLEQFGYNPVVVMSAEEARTVFSENPKQFDLIMVDHILSDESGINLAADLLRIRPDILIALYTGGNAEVEDVRSKGIRAVIPKGLSRGEFRETLERIFGRT